MDGISDPIQKSEVQKMREPKSAHVYIAPKQPALYLGDELGVRHAAKTSNCAW